MVWLFTLLGVLLLLVIYVKYLFSHWERKGFPSTRSTFPFGSFKTVIQEKETFGEFTRDLHLQSKTPILGLYILFRPALLICDAALVKRILITDFDHFVDRGVHYDEENDPMGATLFGMQGQQWKDLRAKLSPTFTSGKLKNMFESIEEKTKIFENHLMEVTDKEDTVLLKKALIHLNLNIIASVFFGFDLNTFANPDHEFKRMGDLFFDPKNPRNKISTFGLFMCPSLLKTLKVRVMSPIVAKYMLNLVNSVMQARKADPSLVRKDFIQTMTEMIENQDANDSVKLTVAKCAAQTFLFYTAGYETSAATSSYCMYELSKSPEWMSKVRAEVDAMMAKRQGKILYEDLPELKVLDQCIKETMRMYPAVPILNRECTVEYRIPGSDKTIPKGTAIIVPVFGLQMDPKYFKNPEKFDPSRFDPENMKEDLPFYPLGGGPRYCVGARLGFLMIRMSLCTMIHNFDFTSIDKKLAFSPGIILLSDKNHIRIKIKKRARTGVGA